MECKLNGSVVYSTCSLSPLQNEGVVNTVMTNFANSNEFTLIVDDLSEMKRELTHFFGFASNCKLGLLVAPQIQKNFGPFYLCRLRKLSKK